MVTSEDRSILTPGALAPDVVVSYGDHEDQVAEVWPVDAELTPGRRAARRVLAAVVRPRPLPTARRGTRPAGCDRDAARVPQGRGRRRMAAHLRRRAGRPAASGAAPPAGIPARGGRPQRRGASGALGGGDRANAGGGRRRRAGAGRRPRCDGGALRVGGEPGASTCSAATRTRGRTATTWPTPYACRRRARRCSWCTAVRDTLVPVEQSRRYLQAHPTVSAHRARLRALRADRPAQHRFRHGASGRGRGDGRRRGRRPHPPLVSAAPPPPVIGAFQSLQGRRRQPRN